MDRVIEVKINGNHLSKDNNLAGVQGEANATYLRIEFDEGWDGYAKTLLWLDAKGEKTTGRILTADLLEDLTESTRIYLAPIPGEALTEWGDILFSVDGYINGKRQKSAYGRLKVKPGDEFAVLEDVTPSQAEQLQVQIDILLHDISEQANIASDAAERASQSAEIAVQAAVSAHDGSSEAHADIRQALAAARRIAEGAASGAEAAQAVANSAHDQVDNAVKKTGDVMTGGLDLTGIGFVNDRMYGGISPEGSMAKLQIIVGDKLTGTDSMFEITTTDMRFTGSDYIEHTVIHTGNLAQYIGVAQASLEE